MLRRERNQIRPVLTYGSKAYTNTQHHAHSIKVAKMDRLWYRITRFDESDCILPDCYWYPVKNLKNPGSRKLKRLNFKVERNLRWTNHIAKNLRSCHVSKNDTLNRAKWRQNTCKETRPSERNNIAQGREREPEIRWQKSLKIATLKVPTINAHLWRH